MGRTIWPWPAPLCMADGHHDGYRQGRAILQRAVHRYELIWLIELDTQRLEGCVTLPGGAGGRQLRDRRRHGPGRDAERAKVDRQGVIAGLSPLIRLGRAKEEGGNSKRAEEGTGDGSFFAWYRSRLTAR